MKYYVLIAIFLFTEINIFAEQNQVKWIKGGLGIQASNTTISPDKKFLLLESSPDKVYDLETNSPIAAFDLWNLWSERSFFLKDNHSFLYKYQDSVYIWSIDSVQLIKSFRLTDNNNIFHIEGILKPVDDDIIIAFGSWDDNDSNYIITIWDIESEILLDSMSYPGRDIYIKHSQISNNGLLLLLSFIDEKGAELISLPNKEKIYSWDQVFYYPKFSPDNNYLIGLFNSSKNMNVYSLIDNFSLDVYSSTRSVHGYDISDEGVIVYCCAGSSDFNFIEIKTGKKYTKSNYKYCSFDIFNNIFFINDNKDILCTSRSNLVGAEIVSIESNESIVISPSVYSPFDAIYSPDSKYLYVYYQSDQLIIFDAETGKVHDMVQYPFNDSYGPWWASISVSKDNSYAAICITATEKYYIYDFNNPGNSKLVTGNGEDIIHIAVSNNGETIAICYENGSLELRNIKTNELQKQLSYAGNLTYLMFSDDNESVYGFEKNSGIFVKWFYKDNQILSGYYMGDQDLASECSFTPDKKTVAMKNAVYNLETGKLSNMPVNYTIQDSYIAPNGKFLAVANYFLDPMASIDCFDVESKELKRSFSLYDHLQYAENTQNVGYALHFHTIAISPNGKNMAGAFSDGTIIVWDIEDITDVQNNELISNNDLAVYPNPAKDKSTLEYLVPEYANVRISIIDISGKPVQEIVNGYQAAGRKRITTELKGLGTGSYYYSINIGGSLILKPFVIVQ